MIGILLLSHGEMAKGMAKSCTLFFGDDIACQQHSICKLLKFAKHLNSKHSGGPYPCIF